MIDFQSLPELDVSQAKEFMQRIFDEETLDVAVFLDRGWGDSPLRISIIKDGDGQNPVARLSLETYKQLLEKEAIAPNNLQTAKARKNHQYRGSRWMQNTSIGMLCVSEEYPRLTAKQKESVRRAVVGFAKRGSKRAAIRRDGSIMFSTIRLPKAQLDLTFGYHQGARYLSSITPVSRDAAEAHHKKI